MSIEPGALDIEDLEYSIPEMLGIPDDERLHIIDVVRTDTAVTIRVLHDSEKKTPLFIKTVSRTKDTHPGVRLGIREVRFYDFINSFESEMFTAVPKCIRHHVSSDGKKYYLVLEDLSETHQDYQEIDFTDLESWKCALTALADFHKNFIGKLSQQQILDHTDDVNEIEGYIGKLKTAYDKFRVYAQGRVDPSVFSLLERTIPIIRKIELEKVSRINQNNITTLLNRDCHLKNFLYPKMAGESAKIVDWQFWGMGIGTFDLRHLLGSALRGDLRKHQRELVQIYYQQLIRGFPLDYNWDLCWEDYRKGVIDNLFMPVWQYAGFGWEYERWESTLYAAIENFYALNCDEITV